MDNFLMLHSQTLSTKHAETLLCNFCFAMNTASLFCKHLTIKTCGASFRWAVIPPWQMNWQPTSSFQWDFFLFNNKCVIATPTELAFHNCLNTLLSSNNLPVLVQMHTTHGGSMSGEHLQALACPGVPHAKGAVCRTADHEVIHHLRGPHASRMSHQGT